MSGSDLHYEGRIHIPRDPNLADLSRHVPHGKMPAANSPEEMKAARITIAAYVARLRAGSGGRRAQGVLRRAAGMSALYPTVQLWDRQGRDPEFKAPLGLSGPPCRERATMAQGNPVLGPPRQAMCRYCGRVTSRVDTEGMAWCGGKVWG